MRNKSGAQYAASKYIEFTVNKPMSLLDFIMESMKGISRNKAKDILTGHGITETENLSPNIIMNYDLVWLYG